MSHFSNFSFTEGNGVIFVDKPAGLSGNSAAEGTPDLRSSLSSSSSYIAHLEKATGKKLFAIDHLDKLTTGATCFATSSELVRKLAAAFQDGWAALEGGHVRSKYWFLTDQTSDSHEFKVAVRNSHTDFKRVKRSPFFELWEAESVNCTPEQLRQQAQELKLNILGDTMHGGTAFPHHCLHLLEIHLPNEKPWTTPAPRFFERLGLLKDEELCLIISAIDRRQRLFNFLQSPAESLRLMHTESADYRLDLYGGQLWLYWYRATPPKAHDLERWEFVAGILKRPLVIRKMQNRGENPNDLTEWRIREPQSQWLACENRIQYQLKDKAGLSPGLFLDQKENRKWLTQHCKDKAVLNLFSYTCAFSLTAASAQAKEVVSVDLSSHFLQWGKENFKLNQLDPLNYEFFVQDVEVFVLGALKRTRKFDFIICDPPSFSRRESGVFRIEKNLHEILQNCWQLLNAGGFLLVSSNFEKWNQREFESVVKKACPQQKLVKVLPGLDFELPGANRLLKSVVVQKQ